MGGWVNAVGVVCLVGVAHAQSIPSADIELLRPSMMPGAWIGQAGARVGAEPSVRAGAVLQLQREPLVLWDEVAGTITPVLEHRGSITTGASIVVVPRLALGASTTFLINSGSTPDAQIPGFSIADLRLELAAQVVDQPDVALAAVADVFVPTGSRQALSGEEKPRLGAATTLDVGPARGGGLLSLGLMARPRIDAGPDFFLGTELTLAVGGRIAPIPDRLEVLVELETRTSLLRFLRGGAETPVEVRAGLRTHPHRAVRLDAAIGAGLSSGYGTPAVRAVLGVTLRPRWPWVAPGQAGKPAPEPQPEPEPEVRDDWEDPVEDGFETLDDEDDEVWEADAPRPESADDLSDFEYDPASDAPPEPKPPPRAWLVDDVIEIDARVLFEVGSDRLVPEAGPVLQAVADLLAAQPALAHLLVEGHASIEGAAEPNYDLSVRRAQTVLRALVEAGVSPVRLSARGMGEVVPTQGADGEQVVPEDRRVVFRVVQRRPPDPGSPDSWRKPWEER